MKTSSISKSLLTLSLLFSFASVALAESKEIKKEENGFINLFNGKDFTDWEQRGGKAKYVVKDGIIVGTTALKTPNSFMCTKKHYSNFILELDFKVDPAMNSGVQIRSNAYDNETRYSFTKTRAITNTIQTDKGVVTKTRMVPYTVSGPIPAHRVHGYQVEIDPSERSWTGGIYDESRRGWLNNLAKNEKARKAFKQNEWNHFKIVADDDSIKTWINGVPAADLKDKMTASGFIGLQVHNTRSKTPLQVMWKNIRLKELSK
ncbi:Putative secreted glycosyl hydrolase [hydrothermal vent metagenome]|uniref:Secreted glycosyl hydrolase n=1 Tax=hydrothermal vent metagenome TaxID=652676 RepID=A0A3B1DIX0_9ZZZZ